MFDAIKIGQNIGNLMVNILNYPDVLMLINQHYAGLSKAAQDAITDIITQPRIDEKQAEEIRAIFMASLDGTGGD